MRDFVDGLGVAHAALPNLVLNLPDPVWTQYRQDGDKEALATRYARFFRSAFVPSLALGLNGTNRNGFADIFENGLKRRLMEQPKPVNSFVHTMVLTKQPERVVLVLENVLEMLLHMIQIIVD